MRKTTQTSLKSERDPIDVYFRFVGFFISEFATTEFAIRCVLCSLLKNDCGFPYTLELIKQIKKEIKKINLKPQSLNAVDCALTQLKHILNLRDRIAHFGGHPVDGEHFFVRTRRHQKNGPSGEIYDLLKFSEAWGVISDLQQIRAVLLHHLHDQIPKDFYPNDFVDINPDYKWRYKALEQRSENPK